MTVIFRLDSWSLCTYFELLLIQLRLRGYHPLFRSSGRALRFFLNRSSTHHRSIMPPNIFLKTDRQRSQLTFPPSDPQVGVFHRTLPHYSPTPLISLPEIAKELGISHLLLKDESSRFGLPAFKILGASWATTQAIRTRLKDELPGKDGGESCSK